MFIAVETLKRPCPQANELTFVLSYHLLRWVHSSPSVLGVLEPKLLRPGPSASGAGSLQASLFIGPEADPGLLPRVVWVGDPGEKTKTKLEKTDFLISLSA